VSNVGGSKVTVRSLVPKGGEVHTFDPSPGDIAAVAEADVIVMNGLGLDEWALDLIEGSGTNAEVVELAEDLEGVVYLEGDEHEAEGGAGHGSEGANPHLWLDVANAELYVDRIARTLAAAEPDDTADYEASATSYRTRLDALDQDIARRMAAIPAANRRIVSFHEAFPYFAAAYGIEVIGVVVEAPGQDPSAGEIAALVEAIRDSGASAVFSEVQFSDRLARTIADEAGVEVESGLHNDSLGDPPADSYVGMMELNAERIEAALR
jgi:ABC-type Zn uptake system ZnuABC Zn-binding protein ZnuA